MRRTLLAGLVLAPLWLLPVAASAAEGDGDAKLTKKPTIKSFAGVTIMKDPRQAPPLPAGSRHRGTPAGKGKLEPAGPKGGAVPGGPVPIAEPAPGKIEDHHISERQREARERSRNNELLREHAGEEPAHPVIRPRTPDEGPQVAEKQLPVRSEEARKDGVPEKEPPKGPDKVKEDEPRKELRQEVRRELREVRREERESARAAERERAKDRSHERPAAEKSRRTP